jgi:hypothetical protein
MGLYDDLFRYKGDKRYDYQKSRKDNRLNLGYDYSEDLIRNNISKHIFRNETIRDFIDFCTDYYMNTIRQIRKMKNWKNFTVDNDDKNVR